MTNKCYVSKFSSVACYENILDARAGLTLVNIKKYALSVNSELCIVYLHWYTCLF